jgi:hypothetical protein
LSSLRGKNHGCYRVNSRQFYGSWTHVISWNIDIWVLCSSSFPDLLTGMLVLFSRQNIRCLLHWLSLDILLLLWFLELFMLSICWNCPPESGLVLIYLFFLRPFLFSFGPSLQAIWSNIIKKMCDEDQVAVQYIKVKEN